MDIPQVVHSINGHLGYFQFGAFMNKPSMNILIKVFASMFSFPLGQYLGVELMGHR